MTTFVFTQAIDSINSKKNSVINTFNNSYVSGIFGPSYSWKDDKIKNKLDELSIQTSTYNKIIPYIYGTVKLAGNVIWMNEVREVKKEFVNTIKTGKNKKTKQKTVEYYYFCDFAIAICMGEVSELKNVWADNELLNLNEYSYRFYSGTSTQNVDSLIESVEGIGKTCAYRRICYIVFENFPLTDFVDRIPNFTFELTRKSLYDINDKNILENKIKAINLIPGCGEFVYSTEVQKKLKSLEYGEYTIDDLAEKIRLNQNNNSNKADCLVSLDQLQSDLPNCEWIAPVISWFGDSLDISSCEIKPKVEYNYVNTDMTKLKTEPDNWYVGDYTRETAEIVSLDENGNVRYGGAPSDESIISLLKELKKRNFKIMFYPMIFMDIINKPWRGYLTGNSEDVENFFIKQNGYNNFILHYANLVKDYVDVFIIGSELKGLTSIKDINNNFPAVDKLIELAGLVRNVVGNNVKISYAADWSEYHHTDGGWYNLDKLWANENIDFIGIDAYFPLTNSEQSNITKDIIKNGWQSGEYYDFYYDENGNEIDLEPQYAIKNIEYWWENIHINPNNEQTLWIPESKKIWFTEYGFSSVDGTTNESNKFYDPQSIDGGFPKLSKGYSDFFAQRKALEATEEFWKDSEMVENKFVWCWDARPYPFFPYLENIWSDGNLWKYGHWLNGKLKLTYAKTLIQQLFIDANLDVNLIDNVEVDEYIDGFIVNNISSLQEILNILKKIYFFDFVEKDGKFNFLSKNSLRESSKINKSELIEFSDNNEKIILKISTISTSDLPNKIQINFIDKNYDYEKFIVSISRENNLSDKINNYTIPVILDENKAKKIAETDLYLNWLEKETFKFVLPAKYLYLETGDLITLISDDKEYLLKIVEYNILENLTISVLATMYDNVFFSEIVNRNTDSENNKIVELNKFIGNTMVNIFELPAINNNLLEKPRLFFSVNGEEGGWKGGNLYHLKNDNYELIDVFYENSIVGVITNNLKNTQPYYGDLENKINIIFHEKINENYLNNMENFDLNNQNNFILIGEEIIQYKNISLNEDGSYTAYNLLRGLFGTEDKINSHKVGEKVILLNINTFLNVEFDLTNLYKILAFKAVSFGYDLLAVANEEYKLFGKNLKLLAVCHLRYNILTTIL